MPLKCVCGDSWENRTMPSWRAAAAWVVALAVATALTWQIVSFADSQVSAQPVEVQATATSSSPASDTTSTSLDDADMSTSLPGTSSTSTSTPDQTTTTSPGASTSSSTATTEVVGWSVRTVNTAGGNVVVRYRPDEVELQSATPAPGFEVEVDESGPPRVRVEFESDDSDIRVEVRWDDGGLDIEIDD